MAFSFGGIWKLVWTFYSEIVKRIGDNLGKFNFRLDDEQGNTSQWRLHWQRVFHPQLNSFICPTFPQPVPVPPPPSCRSFTIPNPISAAEGNTEQHLGFRIEFRAGEEDDEKWGLQPPPLQRCEIPSRHVTTIKSASVHNPETSCSIGWTREYNSHYWEISEGNGECGSQFSNQIFIKSRFGLSDSFMNYFLNLHLKEREI